MLLLAVATRTTAVTIPPTTTITTSHQVYCSRGSESSLFVIIFIIAITKRTSERAHDRVVYRAIHQTRSPPAMFSHVLNLIIFKTAPISVVNTVILFLLFQVSELC